MIDAPPNMKPKVFRIVVVDDHPVVREGLRALLSCEADFLVCGDAGTNADALNLIRAEAPDAVIVDVLLDHESGLDLIRDIKTLNPRVRVLAHSMHDDQNYAERALAAGAQGYINKREVPHKIIAALRMVLSGEVYLSERMKQHILQRSIAGNAPRQKTPIESLTNRELEIFRLIGKGLTTSEISDSLNLSTKTVETHRQNIRRHLQLDNTNKLAREATQWVLENG